MPPLRHERYDAMPSEHSDEHVLLSNETAYRMIVLQTNQQERINRFSSNLRPKIAKVYYPDEQVPLQGTAAWLQKNADTGIVTLFTQPAVRREQASGTWATFDKPTARLFTDGLTLGYPGLDETDLMLTDEERLRFLTNVGETLDIIERSLAVE